MNTVEVCARTETAVVGALSRYGDIVVAIEGVYGPLWCSIALTHAAPIWLHPQRLPLEEKEWVVFAKKKVGSWWFCMARRQLKAVTKPPGSVHLTCGMGIGRWRLLRMVEKGGVHAGRQAVAFHSC